MFVALNGIPGDERLERREPLGLFSSLPIYWNEAATMSDLLDPAAPPHWVRSAIERQRELRPIDVLTPEALGVFSDLLLAQPRALSPAENVALDDWVRSSGRLLLFADPALTEESSFAMGDARRPQDVILLSPILARWGLELHFDEEQAEGERQVDLAGGPLPVDLPGHFTLMPVAPDAPSQCSLLAGNVVADCRVGKGRVLIVADAALLERHRAGSARSEKAFLHLMAKAYPAN